MLPRGRLVPPPTCCKEMPKGQTTTLTIDPYPTSIACLGLQYSFIGKLLYNIMAMQFHRCSFYFAWNLGTSIAHGLRQAVYTLCTSWSAPSWSRLQHGCLCERCVRADTLELFV